MNGNQNIPTTVNNNTQESQVNKPDENALPVEQQPTGGKTILIVEDDPVLSRMYTEKFKHEGFLVLTALNGEMGLKTALEQKVDIILLDIMLPKLSGTDLLETIRQDPHGKNIPVVALTNLAEQEEKDRAISLGVKEYLVKAMQTPEQVVEKIKKYIS